MLFPTSQFLRPSAGHLKIHMGTQEHMQVTPGLGEQVVGAEELQPGKKLRCQPAMLAARTPLPAPRTATTPFAGALAIEAQDRLLHCCYLCLPHPQQALCSGPVPRLL